MHVTIIVLHHTFKAVNLLMIVCCFATINSGWVVVLLVVSICSSESYHVHIHGETANKILNCKITSIRLLFYNIVFI